MHSTLAIIIICRNIELFMVKWTVCICSNFRCSTCSEFFLTEKQLKKHQKLTHLLLPFKCNHIKCVESFVSIESLNAHKKKVHAKSPCPLCGKQVMTVFMEQHYERMHNKDKQGICDQCGRVFPNSYMLKIHIKSEHDDPERFHCDICKGIFELSTIFVL